MKYRDGFQKTDSFRFDRNTSSSSGYGSDLSLSPTDHSFTSNRLKLSRPKTEIYECVWNLDEQIDRIRSTINQQIHSDSQSIISMSVDEPSSIHDDQELLSAAAWYQEGLPRHICEEYLLDINQPIGSFIIRHSHTHPEYRFVLSVKTKSSFIEHFLLERTIDHDGYRLQVCFQFSLL